MSIRRTSEAVEIEEYAYFISNSSITCSRCVGNKSTNPRTREAEEQDDKGELDSVALVNEDRVILGPKGDKHVD